jgi:hypothetical protein
MAGMRMHGVVAWVVQCTIQHCRCQPNRDVAAIAAWDCAERDLAPLPLKLRALDFADILITAYDRAKSLGCLPFRRLTLC